MSTPYKLLNTILSVLIDEERVPVPRQTHVKSLGPTPQGPNIVKHLTLFAPCRSEDCAGGSGGQHTDERSHACGPPIT